MKYLIHLLVILVAFNLSIQQDFQNKQTEKHDILADLKKEVEKASFQAELADEQEYGDKEDDKITEQDMETTEQEENDGGLQLEGLTKAKEQQDDGERAMATQDEAKSQWFYYRHYRHYKKMMHKYKRYYHAYRRYYYQQLKLHRRYKHLYKVYYRSNSYCMHHMTHRG